MTTPLADLVFFHAHREYLVRRSPSASIVW